MGPELVIAGWFASAAIGQLIGLAFSYIKEHPVWLRMKKELKKLHAALERIKAVVEKVEKLAIINDCTRAEEAWLWQLKDAVDEANDVLDELGYYKLEEDVKSGGEKVRPTAFNYPRNIIRSATFAIKHSIRLKKKLKKAAKNLVRVADSAGDLLLSNEHEKKQQQIIGRRESGCLLTEDKVFGREKEREKIVGWLKKPRSGEHESGAKENVTVLPIVGLPGIGKTTLAQHVYGEENFDLRMWVCVSNNFDVKYIMKKIIKEAAITDRQAEELSTLQKILKDELESKKFLLVLDDVWNDGDAEQWKYLVAPLKYGKQGSKILLTTRMNSVAEMIRTVMKGTEEPMSLQGIEWSEYLSLFNKHAFAGVNPGDLEKLQLVGNQIAEKLGKSPLVAKTVGGMLNSNMSFDFWVEVLENGVFNSIQKNNDFQPILRFSYVHLSPQLQRCFRYCSIFPQDYLFEKNELIQMWMAAGLIQQSEDEERRPEDIGGEYFDCLLRKSFFNWAMHWVGTNTTYYVIHDLLHEMICSVSKNECLGVDYSKPKPRDIPTTLRHLSIMVDDPLVLRKVPRLKNLHTLVLRIHGNGHRWDDILNKVNKMLKGFKNLRVLKLESSAACKRRSLNAIGDLKHLRYLHLDNFVDISQLPKSMYKLFYLQTMIALHLDPSTKSIDKVMRSLINLRHLIMPLELIPTIAEIGKLTSLQELDEFHVKERNGYKIAELKHLRELRGELRIKNLENVRSCEDAIEAELLNKKHLRTLQLQWDSVSNSTPESAARVIDGLEPHSNLAHLKIIGYSGALSPRWLATEDLNMLESITLSNCKNLKLLPPLEKLPFLKFLSLENMGALTEVGHTVTAFRRLEVLKFRKIPQLKKWSGVEDGQWFPCLKNLKIEHCIRLMALPPLPHSLERLEIYDVGLTTLPRLWECRNNDCKSSSPSKLRLLKIQCCRKLTSLAGGLLQRTDHFRDVEELFIQQCKELVHLPVEGFQKLISLRSLYIRNCPCLQRHNAPHDDFFFPSSIQKIFMMDCGEMDASLAGAMQHIASLSVLHLQECTSITSLPSAEVFRRLKMLHNLSIVRCTELTSLGGLQALISLKCLEIRECPKLVEAAAAAATPTLPSDPDERTADGSSLSLDILKIDDTLLLHLEPLRSLTSIGVLHLWDCSRLPSLPEEWPSQVRSPDQVLQLNRTLSLKFHSAIFLKLASLQEAAFPSTTDTARTAPFTNYDPELEDLFHKKIGKNWNRIADIHQEIIQSKKQKA